MQTVYNVETVLKILHRISPLDLLCKTTASMTFENFFKGAQPVNTSAVGSPVINASAVGSQVGRPLLSLAHHQAQPLFGGGGWGLTIQFHTTI